MKEIEIRIIVVMDYSSGCVYRFPYRGDAERAYHHWLENEGIRDKDCYWMATTLDRVCM